MPASFPYTNSVSYPNFITEALREGLGVEDIHVQCGIDIDVIRREVDRLRRMGVLRELTQMPKREACA